MNTIGRERAARERAERIHLFGIEKAGKMNAIMCFVYVLNERNKSTEREGEEEREMNELQR